MPNDVMNIKEVADYLGVHTSTIYKYAQQGNIPAFKIGSDWRFSKKYIDKWIDAQMQGTNATDEAKLEV
ncbi:MAG: helix-turn-helix domain-containing protein [Candidatus Omnitrophica bacterium]|nr:helix-turn-helix domain-containing protein [Candidatus Omnitrophota bacterium]